MYFETGQGAALSADAHHGIDQQTMEARAYAVARAFDPLLVNTVVGFIGPEYLYDGKEIIRAGLEDHFCGKLLGLPMGVDVCYTNHAEADQDDMDTLLTLLGVAGVNFVMGVPGSDDIMLNYQSTSYHDAAYVRGALGLRAAPEFEAWAQGVRHFRRRLGRAARRRLGPSARSRLLADGGCWRPRRWSARRTRSPRCARFTAARIGLGRARRRTADRGPSRFRRSACQGARRRSRRASTPTRIAGALARPASRRLAVAQRGADERATYLRRPDLGRRLDRGSRARLRRRGRRRRTSCIVIGDGLSAPCGQHLCRRDRARGLALLPRRWRIAPGRLATGARVALVRPDRRGARRAAGADADRRAAGAFGRRQPRRLSHPRPAAGPHRCRPQLRLQHPRRRSRAGARGVEARRPARRAPRRSASAASG